MIKYRCYLHMKNQYRTIHSWCMKQEFCDLFCRYKTHLNFPHGLKLELPFFKHHLLFMCSCVETSKPPSCFQMCRRVRYWKKSSQQTVVRLRWRQRAQEVFQRLFTIKSQFFPPPWIYFVTPPSPSPHLFVQLPLVAPHSLSGWTLVFLSHSVGLISSLCMVIVLQLPPPEHKAPRNLTDICCLKYFSVFGHSVMGSSQTSWIQTKCAFNEIL